MSISEFLYPVVQAWDWWHLWSTKGVQIQIGGADQLGNITSGADAINSIARKEAAISQEAAPGEADRQRPVGFTVPLLTTASGEKFGKSAGNAVWLDGQMTSPFKLYQVGITLQNVWSQALINYSSWLELRTTTS